MRSIIIENNLGKQGDSLLIHTMHCFDYFSLFFNKFLKFGFTESEKVSEAFKKVE